MRECAGGGGMLRQGAQCGRTERLRGGYPTRGGRRRTMEPQRIEQTLLVCKYPFRCIGSTGEFGQLRTCKSDESQPVDSR